MSIKSLDVTEQPSQTALSKLGHPQNDQQQEVLQF